MDALHLKSKGVSNQLICSMLGICNNTVLKSNGFRCLQVGVVPAKTFTEEKKRTKRIGQSFDFELSTI
jgi:hypothetical protein